ncbi:hypothetical protein ACAG39_01750 [Caldicellulosiruptoraceae bacterium PP1]
MIKMFYDSKLVDVRTLSKEQLERVKKELQILIGKTIFANEYGYFPEKPQTRLSIFIDNIPLQMQSNFNDLIAKLQYLYAHLDILSLEYEEVDKKIRTIEDLLMSVGKQQEDKGVA